MAKKINILNLVEAHPNVLIFVAGVFGFAIFYFSASKTEGLNRDLSINLAASSLIIAVTVLVVDLVRDKHQRLTVQSAAIHGVSKIQMANFGAITLLGDCHFNDLRALQDEYLNDLLNKKPVPKKNYIDDYLIRLLKIDSKNLLSTLDPNQIQRLRVIMQDSLSVLDATTSACSYAFHNKLRSHLLDFRETIFYSVFSLSNTQLSQKNGLQRASQMLSIYLEKIQEFQNMKKY